MSLAKAIMKQKQLNVKQSVKNTKVAKQGVGKSKQQPKEFNYQILSRGGESVLNITTKDGKKREVAVSVQTDLITYTPKYKFHYRNCFGNIVFIKVQKQSIAQEVCDFLEEAKGKYTVSGSAI
ncbi:MAG: hypothetical protein KBT03_13105 [Bacteroidales bacterium]|nr:hypothetical protein [Candidatus Scybalousia scybalohippi]